MLTLLRGLQSMEHRDEMQHMSCTTPTNTCWMPRATSSETVVRMRPSAAGKCQCVCAKVDENQSGQRHARIANRNPPRRLCMCESMSIIAKCSSAAVLTNVPHLFCVWCKCLNGNDTHFSGINASKIPNAGQSSFVSTAQSPSCLTLFEYQ